MVYPTPVPGKQQHHRILDLLGSGRDIMREQESGLGRRHLHRGGDYQVSAMAPIRAEHPVLIPGCDPRSTSQGQESKQS